MGDVRKLAAVFLLALVMGGCARSPACWTRDCSYYFDGIREGASAPGPWDATRANEAMRAWNATGSFDARGGRVDAKGAEIFVSVVESVTLDVHVDVEPHAGPMVREDVRALGEAPCAAWSARLEALRDALRPAVGGAWNVTRPCEGTGPVA